MMKFLAAIALALLFLSAPGFAEPPHPERQIVETQDTPPGHPYNVGRSSYDTSQVPLRDYLSSRIDAIRSELIDRMNERDVRYSQRFDAQQQALQAALQAAKEAVANALSAAKEAVDKAELSINERLKLTNELRGTVEDQRNTFATKETLNLIDEKVSVLENRLNEMRASTEGANNLWGYIIGAIGIVLIIGNFVLNARRDQRTTKAR